ncbi:MAG: family 43 glycosylhydrolase [Clostridia bacterium]|nr:family 43 glycosylhydrolase [Clostridia bacterium]
MQYENPILRGFHPDPSICRVGEDFYLVVSSFEYFPGLPVYHSRDLVNWRHIGNCLQRAEEFPLLEVGDSGGVWAPTIRWHEGVFYVTATLEKYGNFIVTAEDPAGTWSSPVWLPEIGGIDPSIYFEDGHTYYCTNEALTSREAISLSEIDVSTGRVIGQRRELWSGTGAHFLEAPHLYRIGGWYYLLVAEGGTFFTHMASIARSRSLWGPYESCPFNPILTNMCDPTWQVQCAGHADLVEDAQGNWWAVHLGVRLARRTMTHLGRETFLTPVVWQDGWPMCGAKRKTVLLANGPLRAPQQPAIPFVPDLSRTEWEPEWIFLRRPDMASHQRIPGAMLFIPSRRTLKDPNPTFAAIRPADFDCVTDVTFTFSAQQEGDEAGLAIRLDKQFHITCTLGYDRRLTLTLQAEDICHTVAQAVLPGDTISLRLTAGKDRFAFTYCCGGTYIPFGSVSTRFLATEFQGRCFTGTVIGLYAACAAPTKACMRVTAFAHAALSPSNERL